MEEVCYKHYAETGRLVEEITFEEFVRLYVNHQPVFELSVFEKTKEAFGIFADVHLNDNLENPTLTREQFMDVLLGGVMSEILKDQAVGTFINN